MAMIRSMSIRRIHLQLCTYQEGKFMITEKKAPLNEAQELYQILMPRVRELLDKEESKEISQTEKEELKKIKALLFDKIVRYGYSIATQMNCGRGFSTNTICEITSELYIEFCNVLYNYDPHFTTPTTYFSRPFKGAITRYLSKQNRKTPYEIQNWKKVNNCIQYFEGKGQLWTPEMISALSGLSLKVVQSTLEINIRSQLVNLDDLYDIKDQRKTPEEEYFDNEREMAINASLKKNLSPEEYELFLLRLNLENRKELSFDRVAKEAGIPLKEARQKLSNISVKLAKDPTLRILFHICEEKQQDLENSLMDDIQFEEEQDILEDVLEQFKDFKF